MGENIKVELRRYLQVGREAMLWKLEGLGEFDVRRPMTPTGTNLLGLVKHLAGVEAGYFGAVFDRPFNEDLPWASLDAAPNQDMWATLDESLYEIIALYQRVWAHADATIDALPIEATGHVPWWFATSNPVTLGRILTHVIAETHRHVGQADIVRELIDGAAGLTDGNDNMPPGDAIWWVEYCDRLESVAQSAGRTGTTASPRGPQPQVNHPKPNPSDTSKR